MTNSMETIARTFIAAVPYAAALGMQIEVVSGERTVMSMPYDSRLVGDPATGVLHGGAVFALLDMTSGLAVMLHPAGAGGTATIDLRVDYMRPATPGQRIVAEAECYNMTRSVAFVRATAWDDDRTRPVATATGAFTIEPRRRVMT